MISFIQQINGKKKKKGWGIVIGEKLLKREKPRGFPGGAVVENPRASAGDARDMGSIPESGRSPEEGNGNPLQCSCLENSKETEEPGRLQSTGSQWVRYDWVTELNSNQMPHVGFVWVVTQMNQLWGKKKKTTDSISSSVMRHFPTRDPPVWEQPCRILAQNAWR